MNRPIILFLTFGLVSCAINTPLIIDARNSVKLMMIGNITPMMMTLMENI